MNNKIKIFGFIYLFVDVFIYLFINKNVLNMNLFEFVDLRKIRNYLNCKILNVVFWLIIIF